MTNRWRDTFAIKRKLFDVVYATGIREKQDFCFFGIECPVFKYACEVWDNCGIGYSDKLENLQLDAARIVTGLPIFTKSEYLII
jgi:hypothetical protein